MSIPLSLAKTRSRGMSRSGNYTSRGWEVAFPRRVIMPLYRFCVSFGFSMFARFWSFVRGLAGPLYLIETDVHVFPLNGCKTRLCFLVDVSVC